MIGQVVSHYKILDKLGEGGMGIVYRAHDTRLDRVVALKFLPPQLSATDQDKTRFLQEARAAAALNHPHICHIYRIDEVDAPPSSGRTGEKLMFIEMEHVDGVTLRKRIAGGPLPLAEALSLATQIGEGLEEAHARGIVHRDIKSDNIMLTARGQAKVMDFGLAKLKGALKLTRSSSTVGTLAYMAPEQLRGAEADTRSDIFSFGVLLYEMLTGRVPFEGAHEAAMMYSIANEPPVPLEKYLADAPPELLHIINRSLEKDPEDRYQSVHDMVIDIRRMRKDSTRVSRPSMPAMGIPPVTPAPATGTVSARESGASVYPAFPAGVQPGDAGPGADAPAPTARRTSSVTIQIPTGRKIWMIIGAVVVLVGLAVAAYLKFGGADEGTALLSIAVADFQNRTQEPELDGLSGMLITAMEQSQRLSVVTRTRMFDILKQMGKADVEKIDESVGREICSRAGIGALVTASIQKFGKLYIIDLKVLDPSKNEYLFTAKEEGEGQESIPSMLDRLSEKTRAGLKEKADEITTSAPDLAAVTTSNMEAYQHFFKGEEYLNKLDMRKAEEELRKAVELDSTFGLAWYRLAYVLDWTLGGAPGAVNPAMPRAMALIDRLPGKERYLLRALAARGNADFRASLAILKEMELRFPNDKEMMYNIGDWSYHAGDLSTCVEYLQKTLAADPVHERALQHLTWAYRDLGQYTGMVETAKKYTQAAKTPEAFTLLAAAYTNGGKVDEGIREFERLRAAFPQEVSIIRALAGFLSNRGDYDRAEAELKKGVDTTGRLKFGAILGLHDLYTFTGQHRKSAAIMVSGIAQAAELRDTAALVNAMLAFGLSEYFLTRSPVKAREMLEQTLGYKIPPTNVDYWTTKAWVEMLIDPQKDLPPEMLGKPWSPVFLSVLAGLRHRCDEARASADTILVAIPPGPKFAMLAQLAHCYYEGGRYNDAMSALSRALSVLEVSTTFLYADGLVLAGKIYEGMGNTNEALRSYGEFLKLWRKADPDLPMLLDVKKRVATLKAVSSK